MSVVHLCDGVVALATRSASRASGKEIWAGASGHAHLGCGNSGYRARLMALPFLQAFGSRMQFKRDRSFHHHAS